jgi:hypothetical protein
MPHDATKTPHNLQKNTSCLTSNRFPPILRKVKIARCCVAALVFSLGCGTAPGTFNASQRYYNGTASVGDFFTFTLDPIAHSLTYKNVSNGDSGTISYILNDDASYTFNDPAGNLLSAYEVPGYSLLIHAAKAGPNHDQPALITALQKANVSLSTWAGRSYNYMQFRTSSGGIEIGSVNVDSQGNVSSAGYWPLGSVGQVSVFNLNNFDTSTFQADASESFLLLPDRQGAHDYMFGTTNGFLAVDTPNGALLAVRKTSTKAFDSSFAGSYRAMFYQKTGANLGPNNNESGTPRLGTATLSISSTGHLTMINAATILLTATLQPVADASYVYGPAELDDPCYGSFTFRTINSNFQQDVFVTFQDRLVLFSLFRAKLPWGFGNTYDYMYGVGLK